MQPFSLLVAWTFFISECMIKANYGLECCRSKVFGHAELKSTKKIKILKYETALIL